MLKPVSEGVSIEKTWSMHDRSCHFGSLRTFRSYIKALERQINPILKLLQRLLIGYSDNLIPLSLLPDRRTFQVRLSLLIGLSGSLAESLHRKGICRPFLESETASLLNHILFHEENLVFMRGTG